ncbi:MAG: hypothetical protein U0795_10670 [Pirellulales bacterium]
MKVPRGIGWWPGLKGLWQRGDLLGLVLAGGFTLLVNLALLATFVWPEALHPIYRWGLWAVVLSIWGRGVYRTWLGPERDEEVEAPGDAGRTERPGDLFGVACREYLRGDWEQTEATLAELLRRDAFDIEARLMWATLSRHRGRLRQAQRQLRRLSRFEAAERWSWEIEREWSALRSMESESESGPLAEPDDESPTILRLPSPEEREGGTHHMRRAA